MLETQEKVLEMFRTTVFINKSDYKAADETTGAAVTQGKDIAVRFFLEMFNVMHGFTSPTMLSRLYDIMETRDSAFLRHHLRERAKDKFATLNRSNTLCGRKSGGYKNATAISPREYALDAVILELDDLLADPPTEEMKPIIRAKLALLHSENYTQYVRPMSLNLGKDMHSPKWQMFYNGTRRFQRHDG